MSDSEEETLPESSPEEDSVSDISPLTPPAPSESLSVVLISSVWLLVFMSSISLVSVEASVD
ncbi:Uncharacterised protein [Chlamydia trachomatis]|nr:Uncharacterised protein [Chlamydia trachomatis]